MANCIPGKVNKNRFIPINILRKILNMEDTETILQASRQSTWITYKGVKIGLLRSSPYEHMPKVCCSPRSSHTQPKSHLHIRTRMEALRKYHFVFLTTTKGQVYSQLTENDTRTVVNNDIRKHSNLSLISYQKKGNKSECKLNKKIFKGKHHIKYYVFINIHLILEKYLRQMT